ncbi:MAG: hypothetical protein OD814_001297 [Candidatus Alkanophagales archaeon MCA70_species_1]|nr:hypothetical protein [Candidatus Alkanophaga volatiphilum]
MIPDPKTWLAASNRAYEYARSIEISMKRELWSAVISLPQVKKVPSDRAGMNWGEGAGRR